MTAVRAGRRRGQRWLHVGMLAGGVALVAAPPARAQACFPFVTGEALTYNVRVGFGIRVGRSALTVSEGDSVRGVSTLLLRFEVNAGAGPIKATQRSASWIDARTLATLRFVKHERSPMSDVDDSVEVYPRERRWAATKGAIGYSPSDLPLDELSFLYFIRTLPLGLDSAWLLSRHYDPARSPTQVRVLGHESLKTDLGRLETWKVELKVRDPAHFRGLGKMIVHLTDDAQRTPVRIETDMREAGGTVMEITSRQPASADARTCAPSAGIPDTASRLPDK